MAVRVEEHVLVQVGEPLVSGVLCERAVAHRHEDGCERDGMVLDHDHLEPVLERGLVNHPREGGVLGGKEWCTRCRECGDETDQRRAETAHA